MLGAFSEAYWCFCMGIVGFGNLALEVRSSLRFMMAYDRRVGVLVFLLLRSV